MERFGERLKELRKAAGLTQTGLADALLLHPQTVSKWERGFSEPDISQLGDLAASRIKRALGIKDFGKIFPGHGGIMDRFDSIMAGILVLLVSFSAIYGAQGIIGF